MRHRGSALLFAIGFLVGFVGGCIGLAAHGGHAQTQSEVVQLIDQTAWEYGLPEWGRVRAQRIAWCESRYQAGAYNRWSGATGVFQFIPSTARAVGINPWSAEQNVEAAIRLMAAGQWLHWRQCW